MDHVIYSTAAAQRPDLSKIESVVASAIKLEYLFESEMPRLNAFSRTELGTVPDKLLSRLKKICKLLPSKQPDLLEIDSILVAAITLHQLLLRNSGTIAASKLFNGVRELISALEIARRSAPIIDYEKGKRNRKIIQQWRLSDWKRQDSRMDRRIAWLRSQCRSKKEAHHE